MRSSVVRFGSVTVVLAGFFSAASAFATTPFVISGNKVAAIFQSDRVWRNVFGPVQAVRYEGHDPKTHTSVYALDTIETMRPGKGSEGPSQVQPTPCTFRVHVSAKNPNDIAPQWEVSAVDVSQCELWKD